MNMTATAAALIEAEAREKMAEADTIEDAAKAAFTVAKNHWMFTDTNTQYSGAIGAVLIRFHDDKQALARIRTELNMIQTLNAAMSGISVNFPDLPEDYEPVGFQAIWDSL